MVSQKIRDYLHTDYQPGERTLLRKIDFFILTFCCLSYFINYVRVSALVHLTCQFIKSANSPASLIARTSPMPMFLE